MNSFIQFYHGVRVIGFTRKLVFYIYKNILNHFLKFIMLPLRTRILAGIDLNIYDL